MNKVENIMVAIDFSDYSLAALNYAADLATDLKAELLLANVINQRDIDMMYLVENTEPSFDAKARIADIQAMRKEMFKELLTQAECGHLQVTTRITSGVPWQKLLEIIGENSPDLLVMATKGRGNLADTIVGSCARKMFRSCPIPLLTIRPPA